MFIVFKNIKSKIRKHKIFIYALLHSIMLLIVVNIFANSSFSFGEERRLIHTYNLIVEYLGWDKENLDSEAFLIDVSYDSRMVPIFDEYGMPMGDAVITDRNKLYRILSDLRQTNTYKYIIFDIHIDPELKTDLDTLLIDEINAMDRIVVPYHKDSSNPLISLSKKGFADYTIMFSKSDFSKYTFVEDGIPSMAERIYEELYDVESPENCCGFLITEEGLAYSKLLIRLPIQYKNRYNEQGELVIHSLGTDVLNSYTTELLSEAVKDKIVVLGSFGESDIHSTYVGDMSGPLLHLNAYHALVRGEHFIHWGLQIAMFVLFFVISLFLFNVVNADIFTTLLHNRFWVFAISFVGYSTILFLFSMICFLLTGQVVEIMMLSLWFSIVQFTKNHIFR